MVTVGLLELVLPGSLVEVQVGLADVVLVGLVPLVPMVVLVLLGSGFFVSVLEGLKGLGQVCLEEISMADVVGSVRSRGVSEKLEASEQLKCL